RLMAITILRKLQEEHPGRFPDGVLRTLQRRIRQWRAVAGPEKEIFFPQQHAPRLQAARQTLQLPAALAKLDRFDLIILDDISYVRKDQAETSVLFELIAERYERRSLLITANQPFSGWDNVFPDPGMTVAAIDRLVHHSTIFELNV